MDVCVSCVRVCVCGVCVDACVMGLCVDVCGVLYVWMCVSVWCGCGCVLSVCMWVKEGCFRLGRQSLSDRQQAEDKDHSHSPGPHRLSTIRGLFNTELISAAEKSYRYSNSLFSITDQVRIIRLLSRKPLQCLARRVATIAA